MVDYFPEFAPSWPTYTSEEYNQPFSLDAREVISAVDMETSLDIDMKGGSDIEMVEVLDIEGLRDSDIEVVQDSDIEGFQDSDVEGVRDYAIEEAEDADIEEIEDIDTENDKQVPPVEEGSLLENRFRVLERLGAGSFGTVHSLHDELTGEAFVAKFEGQSEYSALYSEFEIYKTLNTRYRSGFPAVLGFGYTAKHLYLIMERLGVSLENLQWKYNNFSLDTVLNIAMQLLKRIEQVHESGFLHMDIKPDNVLIGKQSSTSDTVYLVDFGLALRYSSIRNYHGPCGFMGSLDFASVHRHKGAPYCYRDDLESLAYLLISLFKGGLPWMGANDMEAIGQLKEKIKPEHLCECMPKEMIEFLKVVRSLECRERPNYKYLRGLLKKAEAGLEYVENYRKYW